MKVRVRNTGRAFSHCVAHIPSQAIGRHAALQCTGDVKATVQRAFLSTDLTSRRRPSARTKSVAVPEEIAGPSTSSVGSRSPDKRQYGTGQKVIVVGAGPGGILAALLLAQRGYDVEIFEKRPEPSQQELKYGSRSIVFGLLPRGQAGMKVSGIRLPERGQSSIWMNGLALSKGAYSHVNNKGDVSTSLMPLPPDVLLVERAALVEHMISEVRRLEPDRVKLKYAHNLTAIDFAAHSISYTDDKGQARSRTFDLLIGADGRKSFVRTCLESYDPGLTHEEHISYRSYKGFHRLPPLDHEDLGDETGIPVTFHLGGKVMHFTSTYWPVRYGTVTGHVSAPGTWFEENPNTEETYDTLIREKFPKFPKEWIPEVCRQLVEAKASPNGGSLRCTKLHGPRTVLLGDAAHGVTPAMGQGCNAALESAKIFAELLDGCDGDVDSAPQRFTELRLEDAHALYHMDRQAQDRGSRKRYSFANTTLRFHNALGAALRKLMPSKFKGSAYSTLFSSTAPYSRVLFALRRDAAIFVGLVATAVIAVVAFIRAVFPIVATQVAQMA